MKTMRYIWTIPISLMLCSAVMMIMVLLSDKPIETDLIGVTYMLLSYEPAWLLYSMCLMAMAVATFVFAMLYENQKESRESAHSSAVRGLRVKLDEQKNEVIQLKTELKMALIKLEAAKSSIKKRQDLDQLQINLLDTRKFRIKQALLRAN